MSEPLVESLAAPEVQQEAEKLGWIPPVRFKGDPERFIDAEDYIRRGEEVLPIVKEQNKRLKAELEQIKTVGTQMQQALVQAQAAIEDLKEANSVNVVKAAQQARLELKAQLANASEAGDHAGVAELTDQLTRLVAAEKEAKVAPVVPVVPTQPVLHPEMVAWQQENSWFGVDKVRTATILGIAQELRDTGNTTVGREFFDTAKRELVKRLRTEDEDPELPRDKVEGARNGGDLRDVQRGGRTKGYAALPREAKDACDADARKFVGKGKRYETADAWRARYADIYFGS